jgi:hypothetical protein
MSPVFATNGGLSGAKRTTTTSSAPGIWMLEEQAVARRANIWPTTGDPYWNDVSLLLHMDGSNGSTTFTDSSSNAFSVTANGNAEISTAQSKFGGASGLFDGTGDYLTVSDATALEPGSSDLTWEMWIKTTSNTQYATPLSRTPSAFATGMWSLMINYTSSTSGDIALFAADYSGASPLLLTTGASVRDDAWHHVAVVRNSSNWTIYIDGTSAATATWGGTIANISGSTVIAKDEFYGREYTGYIDDLRITKSVARYTANFTAPTAPFPTGP